MIAMRTLSAFGLTLLLSSAVLAQAEEKLRVQYDTEGEYTLPLGWLNGEQHAPIELRGADARSALKLPIPHRLHIEEGKLEMIYTNSISLLPRSQLAVTLNERVLAQLPLKASQPDNAARINLPTAALKPGYRDLGFRAAQHYTNECEDPSVAELYSQIDTVHSSVRFKTHRKPIEPSLAKLDRVFDKKLWLDRYELELWVPAGSLEQEQALRQAADQASQAVARFFDFLPMSVRIREFDPTSPLKQPSSPALPLPDKAWDAVLLGTRDELATLLEPALVERIKEGYIGLLPSPRDPTRAILIISGLTPAQVLQAATVLNLPGIALPDRAEITISELMLDEGFVRTQPEEIEDGWTTFANLGFKNTTMHGMYPPPAQLEFWAFREMLDPAKPYIEVDLNFAYGAGFDKKSALNIMLNDTFVQALPLQDKHGEQLFHAKVKLPSVALRPGTNTLSFAPSVIGEDVGGACQPIFTDNLYVTIFADSRIELPPISDYLRIPDLGLMAKTGMPYTRLADGKGVGILLSDMRPETINSALTITAKLRQLHKQPLISLRWLSPTDDLQGLEGLIVVGDTTSLPESVLQEMAAFLPGQRWQTLQIGTHKDKSLRLDEGLKRWIEHPTQPLVKLAQTNTPAIARVVLTEGLGQSTAAVQYFSPKLSIPVTVFTAGTPEQLEQGTRQLVEHATWAALDGSATLWSADGESVQQAFPVTHQFIGEKPAVSPVSYIFSDRPWLSVAAALFALVLLAALSWWLLRMRARCQGLED